MLARRWARQDEFLPMMQAAAARWNVPLALLAGTAGVESAFNPNAVSADGSFGLMQLIPSTAAALGYRGSSNGLLDPATSLELGAHLLGSLLPRVGYNAANAASAYNGGERPELGFGAPLTRPLRLCQGWDSSHSTCLTWFNAAAGQYGNQPYVDKVLGAYQYFAQYFAEQSGGAVDPGDPLEAGTGSSSFALLASVGLASALLIAARRRRRAA